MKPAVPEHDRRNSPRMLLRPVESPKPRPVCSIPAAPTEKQTIILIGAIYFDKKPFLHCINDGTRWLKIGKLRPRHLSDQIGMLKRIQFNRHGIPNLIRGDQEFITTEFLNFCNSLDIQFSAVAANHHESNAIVKRANRSICEHVT